MLTLSRRDGVWETSHAAYRRLVYDMPGFVDYFVPYPPNARPGAGASIYD